jgi:hypothetical protein
VRALIINEREAHLLTGLPSGPRRGGAGRDGAGGDRDAGRARRARGGNRGGRARARRAVEAVDTTGAGDLFTAAYVWADLAGRHSRAVALGGALRALSVRVATATAGAVSLKALLEEGAGTRADVACAGAVSSDEGGAVRASESERGAVVAALAAGCGASPGSKNDSARQDSDAGGDVRASGKPDIAKSGRSPDRVGPGGPRRSEQADEAAESRSSSRSIRTSRSSGSRSPSRTCSRRSSSRPRGRTRRTCSRPTRAAGSWARWSRRS